MGLYLKQSETRSELQEKLAAELQERARKKAKTFDQPDGITDSEYLRQTKPTTSLAWVWTIIVLAVIVLVIWLLIVTAK